MKRTTFAKLALAALLLLAAGCDSPSVQPERAEFTPTDDTENVWVVVPEDEIVLNGRLFGRENEVMVILSHMRPTDQTAWFSFAEELAGEGFAALTYNFRGYGDSEGNQDFDKLDEDLETMLGYVRDRGWSRVYLVGASMGGTTSLVVAEREDVEGVVAVSAPSRFEAQNALEAVPNVAEPKLLIAAEDDLGAAVSLDELLEAAAPPTESERYIGSLHGSDLFEPASEHNAAIRARVIEFLRQNEGS